MKSFDIVKSIIYANDCSSKVVSQFGVVTPWKLSGLMDVMI
jgi:hypothetical protein